MLSEQQKRDFCAIMLSKYGVQLDVNNELLPVFYVAYRSAVLSEKANQASNESIVKIIDDFEKKTANKLSKLPIKQFNFNTTKQAFWFSFGRYGVISVVSVILLFCCWLININAERAQYDNKLMLNFVKGGLQAKRVDKRNTAHIITLFPVEEFKEAEAGKNYVFDKECNCIQVPVYFETTP